MPRTRSFAHEDPHELVRRFPVGSKLRQQTAGYWFARTPAAPGVKSRKVYVGSDANKALVERAWAIVGAELAELEATPEVRKLRALEARPALARVPAPMVEEAPAQVAFKFAAAGGRRRRPKE